ncbi:MAG: hypothetical protein V4638_07835 [Bacteroidota bacterium]
MRILKLFYKIVRIEEIPILIDQEHPFFEHSSVICFGKWKSTKAIFFEDTKYEMWESLIEEMFVKCLANLVLSKRIQVNYVSFEKKYLFDLFRKKSNEYQIYLHSNSKVHSEDFLTNNIVNILSQQKYNNSIYLKTLINEVFNFYLGTTYESSPGQTFFQIYSLKLSKNYTWIKTIEKKKYWGLKTELGIQLDPNKHQEFYDLNKQLYTSIYILKLNSLPFKYFINTVGELTKDDLIRRMPSD